MNGCKRVSFGFPNITILVSILEEKLSGFHIEYAVSCGVLFFPFIPTWSFFFIMQNVEIVKCFFSAKQDDHVIYFLHSINVVYCTVIC